MIGVPPRPCYVSGVEKDKVISSFFYQIFQRRRRIRLLRENAMANIVGSDASEDLRGTTSDDQIYAKLTVNSAVPVRVTPFCA